MPAHRPSLSINPSVIVPFLIFAVIAFLYFAAEVLRPLALAILLSFALAPVCRFLERWHIPRTPAVFLTVIVALGTLGGVTLIVGQQLTSLANDLPEYRDNIIRKLDVFRPQEKTALEKASEVADEVASTLSETPIDRDAVDVRIVRQPTFQERLQTAVGPYLEPLAIGGLVLILVLFMLMYRAEMSGRVIQLFGSSQMSLTTRTLEEVGQRISRYLAVFSAYNAMCGFLLGVGLWLIGVPYAVLWGFLAAALRFIPYVGPWTAFGLPLIFAIAHFETWREPILVIVLFLVLESISNGFLEPIIYGRTAGITAVGLLVAAIFWTWLWGPLGLLLSTPLTTCLAVLGKYVPHLRFFSTLLGEEAALGPDVRLYQKLLMLDHDSANTIIEDALKEHPRAAVFDSLLIPTLSRAERDHARGVLDNREQAFIWRIVREVLDELEGTEDLELATLARAASQPQDRSESDGSEAESPPARVVGIATNDTSDALALQMLRLLLPPKSVSLEIVTEPSGPMALADRVAEVSPAVVVMSHLPPVGLTPARYLIRRLRVRLGKLPIMLGRWGGGGDLEEIADRARSVGASHVVFRLSDARDRILKTLAPQSPETPTPDRAATLV